MKHSEPIQLPLTQPQLEIITGDGNRVRRTVLPNGVRVLSEQVSGARSTSIGFWVPVGSRDEHEGHFGSTHFLEHLLFKGTASRSALDIAVAFDEVGGESNAMTAKEYTCYYAKVRDRDVPMAVDVIADMLLSSHLEAAEFENERQVILEELAMAEDDPGDVASELFAELVFAGHELGRPIGGTNESITQVSRDAVWEHYRENYAPGDVVITVAGAVDHDALLDMVTSALARYGWDPRQEAAPKTRRQTTPAAIDYRERSVVKTKDLEQVSLFIGAPGLPSGHDDRFALSVVNTAFGSGMSSRLFQEIREKRGMAYSVYAYAGSYADAGMFAMYAGTLAKKAADVAELMREQLTILATNGLTTEELVRAKGQISGGIALSFEDSNQLMSRLGKSEIGLGEFTDLDTVLDRVESVTLADCQRVAQTIADQPLSLAAVGPLSLEDLGSHRV